MSSLSTTTGLAAGDVSATVEALLLLLLVTFAVVALAERLRLPYPIALVLVGLLGFQPGFHNLHLTPDLILLVFLPLLLFEGAYNVSARRLWQNVAPIALMAVPGVVLAALVTGAVVHAALGLSWEVALLFGALIASTDPIAVVSLFRRLGVPRRLALLVEGESLFNDGASITLFQLILATILTGEVQLGLGAMRFALAVVGAVAIGSAIGYAGSHLMRRVDNAQAQILATLIAAYGTYVVAEALGVSGAIAVVMVGLFFGNYGATAGIGPRSVVALGATWEFLGFMANSLIFLLIGIELDPLTLARNWWVVVIAFVGALAGRAVAVYALLPWLRGRWAIPWRFGPEILWGGLRGAVSLALVLSLPFTLPGGEPFPDRALLQILTFGVVALSLVGQGLTMPPLIRALGLSSEQARDGELEEALARLHAVEAALLALAHERDRGEISSLHYERLANAYRMEREQLSEQARRLEEERGDEDEKPPDIPSQPA